VGGCCHYKIQPRGLDGTRILASRNVPMDDPPTPRTTLSSFSRRSCLSRSALLGGGRGPSHDEVSRLFRRFRLEAADPQKLFPGEQIGKMKRVREVLSAAIDTNAPAEVAISDQADPVTSADRACRFCDRVDAGAG